MHPHLLVVPIWTICLVGGGMLGFSAFGTGRRLIFSLTGTFIFASAAGAFAYSRWGKQGLPVQSYGTMILIGFVIAVWLAARRARRIGVEPRHCIDIGVFGVGMGLIGSRLFHIFMHWSEYNPFADGKFQVAHVVSMFKVWEGGLVFFGAFVVVLPSTYLFCRWNNLPPIKILDLTVPSLILGQAFGRVGCFLNGCCFGAVSNVPWSVKFPPDSPAYDWHVESGRIAARAACSLPVHPAQIYAAVSALLTAGFLYALWPRRKYDGQILSLMMIMAASTRFFEELLRDDESAIFPSLSSWMTIAQWLSLVIFCSGVGLLIYFRNRAKTELTELD